jgi:hypothetical protein
MALRPTFFLQSFVSLAAAFQFRIRSRLAASLCMTSCHLFRGLPTGLPPPPNSFLVCEISSSHGGEYEAQNLLGCTAVFLIECRPTFQRYVLPPSSGHGSTSQKILSFSFLVPSRGYEVVILTEISLFWKSDDDEDQTRDLWTLSLRANHYTTPHWLRI